MTKQNTIKVVSLGGFALNGLDVQVAEALNVPTAQVQQYDWNSEGYETSYFTSHPIPEATDFYDVLSAIWELQDDMIDGIIENRSSEEYVTIFTPPYQFEVEGQQYEWVAEMLGYYEDSTDADDDRYQE